MEVLIPQKSFFITREFFFIRILFYTDKDVHINSDRSVYVIQNERTILFNNIKRPKKSDVA